MLSEKIDNEWHILLSRFILIKDSTLYNEIRADVILKIKMRFNNLDKLQHWHELNSLDVFKKNYKNQLIKKILLLKLYNFYDTTITNKMRDIEIIMYDKHLVHQIMNY